MIRSARFRATSLLSTLALAALPRDGSRRPPRSNLIPQFSTSLPQPAAL